MRVLIEGFINDDRIELEYYSKYNRINAKGIKEEAAHELFKNFGTISKYVEITGIYRQD